MKKVDKLRQEYEEIQTPQDLDSFMDTCIDQAQKKQSRFTFYRLWKPALSAALIGYLIVLNTVPAFAQSVFAIPLLGDVSREGENDVRHRYSSVQGTAEFSMNGTFSVRFQPGAWAKEHERSYEDASQSCLERIDFQGTLISSESGERPGQTVLTYYQNWEGTPLFSCQVTLLWQDDTLLRMEGQRLSGTITSSSEEETLSAATVLVRFLAGVTEGGFVCSRIDEMNAGYLIVSGTTRPVELTPVWRITTDSGAYYVDAITGELSPTED